MKKLCLLLLLLSACKHERKVNTSFYYWKTIYKLNQREDSCLRQLHTRQLYVRIMDVDIDDNGEAVPVSPITFKEGLPDTVKIVPVVFIVNDILKDMDTSHLDKLAAHIVGFISAKVKQAGKPDYHELQIDCDWTATSRDNYFYLLKQISKRTSIQHKIISATLRLHQLKNQKTSGIPPVSRVMLMCYNMGNLRKYGTQNSILELSELKKYLNGNVSDYPLPMDVGLPLFSWAVAFRDKQYVGISKSLKIPSLINKNQFKFIKKNLYETVTDLPEYGLKSGDEIRWESVSESDLNRTAAYVSPFIKTDSLNIIYFHLDDALINTCTYAALEKTAALFR
jgi:hypothetical protein